MNKLYEIMIARLARRNQEIRDLRTADQKLWTFAALGKKYGLTGQRIQVICKVK